MGLDRLRGKVAVVTGAHTAIGEAIIKKFASEGAKVAFFGSDESMGKKLLESVKGMNGEGLFEKVGISNRDEVKAFFDKVSKTFGDVDALVTVPVVKQNKPFIELEEADWVDLMENDGLGAVYAMWETLPAMKRNRKGSILAVTSLYGSEAGVNTSFVAYFMAGMHNMIRCVSMEYSPWGIRVNALAPGLIADDGESITKEEVFQIMGDDTLRRPGTAEEVAGAALWLSSDEASYITGAILNVDGGVVSRSMVTKTWQTGETEFLREFEYDGETAQSSFSR